MIALEWVESTICRLFYAEVTNVIGGLRKMKPTNDESEEEIRKLIGYLGNNRHRIHYRGDRIGGYPKYRKLFRNFGNIDSKERNEIINEIYKKTDTLQRPKGYKIVPFLLPDLCAIWLGELDIEVRTKIARTIANIYQIKDFI